MSAYYCRLRWGWEEQEVGATFFDFTLAALHQFNFPPEDSSTSSGHPARKERRVDAEGAG